MNYNIQLGLLFEESQVWYPNPSFYSIFDQNRDATVEGRTALDPTDEDIRSSNIIEIVDDEPFSIEVTQVNEDVTAYNNIIRPALQIDENQIFITDETRAMGVLNNGRLNQTIPTASVEEIRQLVSNRNENVPQTITAVNWLTNAYRRIHHNQIEPNDGREEESST